MPDLNLSLDFFDHPKTVRLRQLAGSSAEALPIRLWIYTARFHRADGTLTGYSPETLEAALGWRGRRGLAVRSLLDCGAHLGKAGFIEEVPGGYQVHDWAEHQGHLERYHAAAVAGARARWGKRGPPHTPTEAMRTGCGSHGGSHADGNAPATQGNAMQEEPPSGVSRARAVGKDQAKTKDRPVREAPPTLAEVEAEIVARGLHVDAQRFLDRNAAAGWMYGKTPIVDWRAALRTWERNGYSNRGGQGEPPREETVVPGSKYGSVKVTHG